MIYKYVYVGTKKQMLQQLKNKNYEGFVNIKQAIKDFDSLERIKKDFGRRSVRIYRSKKILRWR